MIKKVLALLILAVMISACATTAQKPEAAMEMYEIHEEGRIYSFYDRGLYNEFLQVNETPFRLTRIGAGPNGETVVIGLTKEDKKLHHDVPAIEVFDGKTAAPANFYGEMRRHGRIYVFDKYEDMVTVRQFGHPNYFYTQIGDGPKGETVVYVLNHDNKKHRPDTLVEKFKAMNKN